MLNESRYTQRMLALWNSLPAEVLRACVRERDLNAFKRFLASCFGAVAHMPAFTARDALDCVTTFNRM